MAKRFMLGRFVATDHAFDQFDERIKRKSKATILKSMVYDLRPLNIKRIIYNDDVHIFTKGHKEFIFARGKGLYILKTIIKRNSEDTEIRIQSVINRKKSLVAN